MTDIEIAQGVKPKHIREIAAKLGFSEQELILYGEHKAKINPKGLGKKFEKNGKIVLVTAINPTPAGEGKTTTTVGLTQALCKKGINAVMALREPSLGPVMGVKGGAAGGGYSQVIPMEDINLHFTGDFHAITAANNLLCAMVDNSIFQGNPHNIDQRKIEIKRVTDTNDRALRNVVVGLGGKLHGIPREEGFTITVACEIMAVLCLANDIEDLRERLDRIIVGYSYDDQPIICAQLKAGGALTLLLKDAILPNLVQSLEHTPAFVHGGPFANIAHGCNSVVATRLGQRCCDLVVTEAGFGADLGAEKFFDIKCRLAGLKPEAVVIVATIRALKYNGGVGKNELTVENLDALKAGLPNLGRHIQNMQKFGFEPIVALNSFGTDTANEREVVADYCKSKGAVFAISEVFERGGEGGLELADAVLRQLEVPSDFKYLYPLELPVKDKILKVAKELYGASDVVFTRKAQNGLSKLAEMGFDSLPICMAKTQYSFSDTPSLLGCPSGFTITITEVSVKAGAGFVVCYAGDILTMPGLSKAPAAQKIDISSDGQIVGLF